MGAAWGWAWVAAGVIAGWAPGATAMPEAPDDSVLLLELAMDDRVLSDALAGYQRAGGVKLPLGELCRQLELAVAVNARAGQAEGFLIAESRPFKLDVAARQVRIGAQVLALDPAHVEIHDDDLYVDAATLATWLPVALDLDALASRVVARPREPLPMQKRLERERLYGSMRAPTPDVPFRRLEVPRALLDGPFIDQTLQLSLSRPGVGPAVPAGRYTTYATAELAWMDAAVFLAGETGTPFAATRFNLGRKDPDGALLGPLRAREVLTGDIDQPGLALIAQPHAGRGVLVSNLPLDQQSQLDRHTFRGDLPPGWDVELYQNDMPIRYQQARTDGQYRFADVPLTPGLNEFKLVFHGPQGQRREQVQRFRMSDALAPVGEPRYRVSSELQADGRPRHVGQLDLGLTKGLGVGFAMADLPMVVGRETYGKLGLRWLAAETLVTADLAASRSGGAVGELAMQAALGPLEATARHARAHHFVSEALPSSGDSLTDRTTVRLAGALPGLLPRRLAGILPGAQPFRLTGALTGRRDRGASGQTAYRLQQQAGVRLEGVSLAHQLTFETPAVATSGGGVPRFSEGALQLGTRWQRVNFRGELGYGPGELRTLALSAEGGPASLPINLTVAYGLADRQLHFNVGMTREFGPTTVGVSVRDNGPGGFDMGLTCGFGFGRDPQQNEWHATAGPLADRGAISARVFLDANQNGRLDTGEQPLEGVQVAMNGQQLVKTDRRGVAFLAGLPVHQVTAVTLPAESLPDPLWVPREAGLSLVPRPGKTVAVDLPVMMTGEVTGTVYLTREGRTTPVGGVQLELVDAKGQVAKRTRSAYDGFYTLSTVGAGRYTLRAAAEQLGTLGWAAGAPRDIAIAPEGSFVDGADLVLEVQP